MSQQRRAMPRRLTAAEREADARMLALLEQATKRPKAWHKIHDGDAAAAALLAKRGVIEVWPETKMYRIKPAPRGK